MQKLPPLVIGIAGFGTVASGLIRILSENSSNVLTRTGREIKIKTVVVRNMATQRACSLPEGTLLTTNLESLVSDSEIDVVVELMGGVEKPKELLAKALEAGKHVVTANKALLAETGDYLFQIAERHGRYIGYEASVCGGIPIVATLKESLAGNSISSIVGILNGTCNYILSEMTTRGMAFEVALKAAQELGFAEADPTLDIEGHDAAHKLALLVRLAWGVAFPYSLMPVQGITKVDPLDIAFAREFGYRIKLVGQARMVDGRIEAGVFPTLVHETFLLARVGGAYNAVRIEGDAVGSVFLHGKGAGDMPTGSAVAADIFAIAKGFVPNNTGFVAEPGKADIIPAHDATSHYYIRLELTDAPGVLRDVAGIMADHNISIAKAIQKGKDSVTPTRKNKDHYETVPFILMTHEATAQGVNDALAAIAKTKLIHQEPVKYRVLAKSS